MEAAKAVNAHGLLKGHVIQASDADQAYTQALLGDEVPGRGNIVYKVKTETWERLPPEARPDAWANLIMRDPVVPLVRALYGHPDAGGYREAHYEKHLREIGFEPVFNWPSVFYHKARNLLVMVYGDDFKMSGPTKNMKTAWDLLRRGVKTDDPKSIDRYLGCIHRHYTAQIRADWSVLDESAAPTGKDATSFPSLLECTCHDPSQMYRIYTTQSFT